MASVNEDLRDRAIRHAVAIARYGNGLSDKLVRLLNSADKEILAKLASGLAEIDERGQFLSASARKHLASLLDEIRALNTAIYEQLSDALVSELGDFGAGEAEFQRKALVSSIGVDLSTKLPSAARMRAIITEVPMDGHLLKGWTDKMEQGRIDRITQALRTGMVQGETTDQLVRRIRGTKAKQYSDGILDISRRSTQSIVRTAVSHISNATAQETWKANEHVIKGWQFVATLDSRTTIGCSALSGQVFPIGEGPIPPRHIRCRSITVAVTKSFRELGIEADELPKGKQASMDGQIAGDMQFSDWLRSKGEATQVEILGTKRAELFNSGKLDLQDFIKKDGTVLTLAELKTLYPNLL